MSNEHLKCQCCNKTCKTETGLDRHKAKCKERDKPTDNNKNNIPSISNDNHTIAFQAIEYSWSQTGNTILPNTIDTIYDKVVFWQKPLFL